MKKLIGSFLKVFFKGDLSNKTLEGLLVEIEDGSWYLQSQTNNNMEVFVIPENNVLYCVTNKIPANKALLVATVEESKPQLLNVVVGETLIAQVPIKDTDLGTWRPEFMSIALAQPEIQTMLKHNKVMSVEYSPGELKIIMKPLDQPLEIPEVAGSRAGKDDFGMSFGGAAATSYLNPSQMVSRLNNVIKKEKG